MLVYVVRHAEAAPREDYPRDEDRPLTERGRVLIGTVAEALEALGASPSPVYTSPLVRARETAEIVASRLGGARVDEVEALAGGHEAREVIDFLAGVRFTEVAVVGHAPQLDEVVSLMIAGSCDKTVDISKASVACVAFDGEVRAGRGVLKWHLVPKVVEALSGMA